MAGTLVKGHSQRKPNVATVFNKIHPGYRSLMDIVFDVLSAMPELAAIVCDYYTRFPTKAPRSVVQRLIEHGANSSSSVDNEWVDELIQLFVEGRDALTAASPKITTTACDGRRDNSWPADVVVCVFLNRERFGDISLSLDGSETTRSVRALVMYEAAKKDQNEFYVTTRATLQCDGVPIAGIAKTSPNKIIPSTTSTLNELKLTPKGVFELYIGTSRDNPSREILDLLPWNVFVLHAKVSGLSSSHEIVDFVHLTYNVNIAASYVPTIEQLLVDLRLCVVNEITKSVDVVPALVAQYAAATEVSS